MALLNVAAAAVIKEIRNKYPSVYVSRAPCVEPFFVLDQWVLCCSDLPDRSLVITSASTATEPTWYMDDGSCPELELDNPLSTLTLDAVEKFFGLDQ